jgi:hypothetical protein
MVAVDPPGEEDVFCLCPGADVVGHQRAVADRGLIDDADVRAAVGQTPRHAVARLEVAPLPGGDDAQLVPIEEGLEVGARNGGRCCDRGGYPLN